MKAQIHFLTRKEIDATRWNNCVRQADNESLYVYTEYLDALCPNWDALVSDDYSAVMPLPWRKKKGIVYLYYPAFCAQLGVVGKGISESLVAEFLEAIPPTIRLLDFPMNAGNPLTVAGWPLQPRRNLVLDLDRPYGEIEKGFRENIRRNRKKTLARNWTLDTSAAIEEVIALAREQPYNGWVDREDYFRFARIYSQLAERKQAACYAVRNESGQIMASAAFLQSVTRCYYLLVGNHPDGKTGGASHSLIDAYIRDHSGQQKQLDFEGSDRESLSFFYSSFGAVEEWYPSLYLNRLPWYLKWLKP